LRTRLGSIVVVVLVLVLGSKVFLKTEDEDDDEDEMLVQPQHRSADSDVRVFARHLFQLADKAVRAPQKSTQPAAISEDADGMERCVTMIRPSAILGGQRLAAAVFGGQTRGQTRPIRVDQR